MKESLDTSAEILTTLIQEDRAEIRIFHERIYNLLYLFVFASFVVTAFFVNDENIRKLPRMCFISIVIDSLFAVLVSFLFVGLKNSLYKCRQSLKMRQNFLKGLSEQTKEGIDPFDDPSKVEPDIHDTNLYYFIGVALIVIALKCILVSPLLFHG